MYFSPFNTFSRQIIAINSQISHKNNDPIPINIATIQPSTGIIAIMLAIMDTTIEITKNTIPNANDCTPWNLAKSLSPFFTITNKIIPIIGTKYDTAANIFAVFASSPEELLVDLLCVVAGKLIPPFNSQE